MLGRNNWHIMAIISFVGKLATIELTDKIRRARLCACVCARVCVYMCVLGVGELCRLICFYANLKESFLSVLDIGVQCRTNYFSFR